MTNVTRKLRKKKKSLENKLKDMKICDFFKKDVICLFLERGREGERKGEKHQCVVASHVPPTGGLAATQACALMGNRTNDPLVHRPMFSPLSHTSQDKCL